MAIYFTHRTALCLMRLASCKTVTDECASSESGGLHLAAAMQILLGLKPDARAVYVEWPPKRCKTGGNGGSFNDEEALKLDIVQGLCGAPLHVSVDRPECRIQRRGFVSHVRSNKLPKKSYLRLCDSVYVAAPELILSQCAKDLGFIGLLMLLCEVTGGYSKNRDASGCVAGVRPRTSLQALRRFIDESEGMRVGGIRELEQAVKYAVADSYSPMESALALLLSLPRRYGGYGLPKPQMNMCVRMESRRPGAFEKESALVHGPRKQRGSLYCDLYWPDQRVAIEYDSDEWHTGSERIAHDAARRNALVASGITVIGATRIQLMDREKTESLARDAARALGLSLRTRDQKWRARNRSLRQGLLGW